MSRAERVAVRERSLERFDAAAMYKPREGVGDQELFHLAPLLVEEIPDGLEGAARAAGFAAVFIDDEWGVWVDVTQPTIYSLQSETTIDGVPYEQIAFFWWGRRRAEGGGSRDPCAYGFRVTLDNDGFPLVWEVSDCAREFDVLYASASLEDAAKEAFGEPPPGGQFAIERPRGDAPATVVVRVLEDGPMPMGPYVYIGSGDAVTTLLCRCMASQVESFVGTEYYEIRPLEELGDPEMLRRAGVPEWSRVRLDQRLRWPYGEGAR